MNIQELHNRLTKRASMQKVAGPKADAFRKVLNEFKDMRVNPQRRANLIANKDVLKRPNLLSMIYPNLKGDINTLLTPASDFTSSDVHHILNMAAKKADQIHGVKGMQKFVDRVEKGLHKDIREASVKMWDKDLSEKDIMKLLQDATNKQDAKSKIIAKKYLGDI